MEDWVTKILSKVLVFIDVKCSSGKIPETNRAVPRENYLRFGEVYLLTG